MAIFLDECTPKNKRYEYNYQIVSGEVRITISENNGISDRVEIENNMDPTDGANAKKSSRIK